MTLERVVVSTQWPSAGVTISGPSVSYGATPVAVDQHGATVYIVTEVRSGTRVYQDPGLTRTSIVAPTTVACEQIDSLFSFSRVIYYLCSIDSFIADASGYREIIRESPAVEPAYIDQCSRLPDGNFGCVAGAVDRTSVGDGIVMDMTHTGPAIPFQTISNIETLNLPTTTIDEASLTAPRATATTTASGATNVPQSAGYRKEVSLALLGIGVLFTTWDVLVGIF